MHANKKLNGGLLPPVVEINPRNGKFASCSQCSFWLRLETMFGCARDAVTPQSSAFLLETADLNEAFACFPLKTNGLKDVCRPTHPCDFNHLQAF